MAKIRTYLRTYTVAVVVVMTMVVVEMQQSGRKGIDLPYDKSLYSSASKPLILYV